MAAAAASRLRPGRGSQPRFCAPRRRARVSQRPGFGRDEDRNFVGGLRYIVGQSSVPASAGTRIATSGGPTTAWISSGSSVPASAGTRIATTTARSCPCGSRAQRPGFGRDEDRNCLDYTHDLDYHPAASRLRPGTRIATRRTSLPKPSTGPAASRLRPGRGSQLRGRHPQLGHLGGQRPGFGRDEDRNGILGLRRAPSMSGSVPASAGTRIATLGVQHSINCPPAGSVPASAGTRIATRRWATRRRRFSRGSVPASAGTRIATVGHVGHGSSIDGAASRLRPGRGSQLLASEHRREDRPDAASRLRPGRGSQLDQRERREREAAGSVPASAGTRIATSRLTRCAPSRHAAASRLRPGRGSQRQVPRRCLLSRTWQRPGFGRDEDRNFE